MAFSSVISNQVGLPPSNSLPIKFHGSARSVNFQSTICSYGIRTNKNPVLPRRQSSEYARLKSLVDPESQIRLKPGQRIERKRRARFKGLANFIFPIKIVRRGRNQARVHSLVNGKRFSS